MTRKYDRNYVSSSFSVTASELEHKYYPDRQVGALCVHVCVCAHFLQVVKRHSVPLGLNADWLHQHPHVLPWVAMDARCLSSFLPTCSSACQSRTTRREWTPLHNVSKVTSAALLANIPKQIF